MTKVSSPGLRADALGNCPVVQDGAPGMGTHCSNAGVVEHSADILVKACGCFYGVVGPPVIFSSPGAGIRGVDGAVSRVSSLARHQRSIRASKIGTVRALCVLLMSLDTVSVTASSVTVVCSRVTASASLTRSPVPACKSASATTLACFAIEVLLRSVPGGSGHSTSRAMKWSTTAS